MTLAFKLESFNPKQLYEGKSQFQLTYIFVEISERFRIFQVNEKIPLVIGPVLVLWEVKHVVLARELDIELPLQIILPVLVRDIPHHAIWKIDVEN